MLERYNPEDFLNIKVVGKVEPIKDKEIEDLVQVVVEVSFNDSLYTEAFIPDLEQVLDAISAKSQSRGILSAASTPRKVLLCPTRVWS